VPALLAQDSGEAAARGVGRFLSAHESCGRGFAIARNGRGKPQVVCGGCGGHSPYDTMDAEQLRAHGVDLGGMAGGRRFQPTPESLERWLPAPPALPWWVPNAYIVGVILFGVALIALGALGPRDAEEPRLSERPTPTRTTAPAPTTPPGSLPAGASAGALGSSSEEISPERPAFPPAPDLRRVSVLDRFALGVPAGWAGGISGGAVVFRAPSLEASLRVFLEPGAAKPGALDEQARRFLAGEHPDAEIRRKARGGLGRLDAVRLVAKHGAGKQWAALLSSRGYTYFLIADVDGGASRDARVASVAALRSFRPR
jgi:hypothetical protein